jgi:uridine kinase
MHPGDLFGELALLAGRPRGASVIASTDMLLMRLTRARYGDIVRSEPDLAIALVHALAGGLGDRLGEMTERVGMLLRERSLPRRTSVEIRLNGVTKLVPLGTPIGNLLPSHVGESDVVAALLDFKPVSLGTPLSADATIAPLATDHWEGERIRRASVGLVLLEAARRVERGVVRRLGPSQGASQLVETMEAPLDLAAFAVQLEKEMHALVKDDVLLLPEWWTVEEASSYFTDEGCDEIVSLLLTWRDAMVPLVHCGETRVIAFGPLLPRAGRIGFFRIDVDRNRLFLVMNNDANETPRVLRPAAEAMTTEHAGWLRKLGVTHVGAFDQACIRGEVNQLLRVSEGFQEKRISVIADEIAGRRTRIKVIGIAGPSSSGKTTFIKRLTVQLQVVGIQPIALSLDDYYVDRSKTPRSPNGELDYEAFEALDAELLQGELSRLLAGEAVRTARYDFKTGKSLPGAGTELRLSEGSVLLLEGIHGLNPKLLGDRLDADEVFRIFVCPLTSLPLDALTRVAVSDLRLIRRIVRDRHTRATTAADTIERWPSVRAGERKHIFPYFDQADAVFDSALIYEPAVLKVLAERYLLEVPQQHAAHKTAWRLLQLLSRFVSIQPNEVPPTSILREFIGGSGFEY